MNILSFDIEEWALAQTIGYGNRKKYAEYDACLDYILNYLDANLLKATFFCTGLMAERFAYVVEKIMNAGHEIGCHSYQHTWMNKLAIDEAREDTHRAVDSLEQLIGMKVISYRAPAFSIGESNKWMFEILADNGLERDASVFPVKRDFGGFPGFGQQVPSLISYSGLTIKEFPMTMTRIMGQDVAYSGGGYFRFFPLSFIREKMSKADYVMTYFHIEDFITEKNVVTSKEEYERYFKEPGTLKNRYIRYLKSNIGKKGAMDKLLKLLATECFDNLASADSKIDWTSVKMVQL
jgi:polysaccharide deacetylase family protein (PEP-CTERM system associated)